MKNEEIINLIKEHTCVDFLIDNFCGEKIGSGLHRDVYIFKPCDKWVVKIEKDMTELEFTNVLENFNYNWNKYFTDFVKFLAPCLTISKDGQALIQRRVKREIDGGSKNYPDKIPNWITDTKRQNFGWIGKQFVCCDYPHLINVQFRMKKAKYW